MSDDIFPKRAVARVSIDVGGETRLRGYRNDGSPVIDRRPIRVRPGEPLLIMNERVLNELLELNAIDLIEEPSNTGSEDA